MNQDESNEQQEPAAEQPAPGATAGPPDNRFRSRPRRPRGGRRDNRGDRGDRGGDRGPRNDRPPMPEGGQGQGRGMEPRRSSGNIGQAIEQVEHIRAELQKVMAEMNEVLETLEQAERDKTATENEIDKLRESLRSLHRDPGYPRNPRNYPPIRTPISYEPQPPTASPEERTEESDD